VTVHGEDEYNGGEGVGGGEAGRERESERERESSVRDGARERKSDNLR